MQTAAGSQPIVETIAFNALAPEGRDPLQVVDRVDAGGVDELVLREIERVRVGVARRHEHARDRETSPASSARRVAGMCVSALARCVCPRAVPHATRNRVASHDAAER